VRGKEMKKVVLITGASSGIGKVTAIWFAKQDHKLVIAARSQEGLQEVHQTILRMDGEVLPGYK
jgi:NADP-dependent 3-hydroxy acid dehydrogenase YdfG